MITLKIDVKKLDKTKFIAGKNGELYAKLVCIPLKNGPGKFGDTHLVKQDQSKEDREAGMQMPIIGNATDRSQKQAPPPPPQGKVANVPGGGTPTFNEDPEAPF